MVEKVTGDGHWFDGCSDDAAAAEDGLRGEWADAGVFGGEINRGEEMWRTWWSSGFFVMVKMKMIEENKEQIKEGEREKEIRFEFSLHKSCENSNIRSLIKSIDIDLNCHLNLRVLSLSILSPSTSQKHSTMAAVPSPLQHLASK